MKNKKQTKTFLTGFTPSTDAEILQRLETTRGLLQSITDIRDVKTIIPDLEKWEQNEIEMKYTFEVIDISNLVRDCSTRLKDKYYQETGLYLPPIQVGSDLGVRVGWLRFVNIHLIGKESQTNAENIAAAVSRDSAEMQSQAESCERQGATKAKELPITKMVRFFINQNRQISRKDCIKKTLVALNLQGRTTSPQYIANQYCAYRKYLKTKDI